MGRTDKSMSGKEIRYLCTCSEKCDGTCRAKNTKNGEVCCTEVYTEAEERRFRERQHGKEDRRD